jgi:uncharacterized membrane protein
MPPELEIRLDQLDSALASVNSQFVGLEGIQAMQWVQAGLFCILIIVTVWRSGR